MRVLRYFESFMIECFHLLKFSYRFFFPANIFIISYQNSQVHDSFFLSLSYFSLYHPLPIHTKQLKRKFVRFASNLGWVIFFHSLVLRNWINFVFWSKLIDLTLSIIFFKIEFGDFKYFKYFTYMMNYHQRCMYVVILRTYLYNELPSMIIHDHVITVHFNL